MKKDNQLTELSETEITLVNGGVSDDAIYGASVASALTVLGVGLSLTGVLSPIGVGVMLGASIFSSGTAIALTTA